MADCKHPCGWNAGLHLKTTTCRGGVIENVRYENNLVHRNFSCISLITNYQVRHATFSCQVRGLAAYALALRFQMTQAALDRCSPTVGYPATVIRNISWVGNSCGSGGGSWACSVNDTCSGITVERNKLSAGYHCEYVKTYSVSGNSPPGLEACMAHSMDPPPPPL